MTTGDPQLPRAFPLCWPDEWARTPPNKRKRSAYKVTEGDALQRLLTSLRSLGAAKWSITTDRPVRLDGLPLAGARPPQDPGVALWWIDAGELGRAAREHRPPALMVLAHDRYESTRENVRAIGHAVDALRALARVGATQILERVETAFAAPPLQLRADNLTTAAAATSITPPPSSNGGAPWWADVLELEPPISEDAVRTAYRRLVWSRHPDHGGTLEQFDQLQRAAAAARATLNR